jgi:serine/threonine protein kinase
MDVVSTFLYTKKHRIDGGQGQNSLGVFCAFDPQVQQDVAIKEIAKTDFPDPDAFFREAQAMFRAEHPNVVAIRTASQTSDTICLAMPLYRNGSLATRIKNGPVCIRDAVRAGREVLAGLGAIHAGGTIHFDLKPSNVLFSDTGVAMIADFGQARELGPNGVTLMPARMYAPLTPPEAFTNGRRGTVLSDIYQASITLYRALNGEPFFDAQFAEVVANDKLKEAIINGTFPRRDRFLPHVPDSLRRIVRKGMSVDPAKRFANASEFSNALAKLRRTNNWSVQIEPNLATTWEADRLRQPALRVVLQPNDKLWGVSIFTVRNGHTRPTKKAFWRDDMSRKDAGDYLNQLFSTLA